MNSIPVKKVLTSALLVVTIHDLIKGFSLDIFAPFLNAILPGDLRRPVKLLGMELYLTRFMVRIVNVGVALLIVSQLNKKKYYNY